MGIPHEEGAREKLVRRVVLGGALVALAALLLIWLSGGDISEPFRTIAYIAAFVGILVAGAAGIALNLIWGKKGHRP